jgi:membrane protease YdiL (CAAX protease family)
VVLLVAPFFTPLKGAFILAPIFYLLVERVIRKRTFREIGFNFKNLGNDVKNNWKLILFVSVVLNILTVLIAKVFLPEYFEHVVSRVTPMLTFNSIAILIVQFLILGLGEEIAFRGFLQGRLSWFIKPAYAIIITSAIFALLHYSSGSALIVSFDLFSVFINSLLYGVIFLKTNNIFASWVAHVLVNLVGIIVVTLMV